jgi:hypothetical protein
VLLIAVAPPISGFASGGPQFEERVEVIVYPTRVHVVVHVFNGGPEFKWHAEYATSEAGPWTPAANGTVQAGVDPSIFLGTEPAGDLLHHLTPNTTYYARFHAENKEGSAVKTVTFTTKVIARPEIAEDLIGKGTTFTIDPTGPHTAVAKAQIESNGAETKYTFEYAPAEANGQAPGEGSPSWVPFEPTGTITVAEDFTRAEVKTTELSPETTYYARVKATNHCNPLNQTEECTVVQHNAVDDEDGAFRTPTARPIVFEPTARNVTGDEAHVQAHLLPHDLAVQWHFEYIRVTEFEEDNKQDLAPKWSVGAEGAISQAQAEALPQGTEYNVEGELVGLSPSIGYYVRLFAESSAGEGRNAFEEPILNEVRGFASFNTFGAPSATTLAVHGLHGEALRVMGAVNPNSVLTSAEQTIAVEGGPTGGTFTLTFEGQSTEPIASNAPAEAVANALRALPAINGEVGVTGPDGGPYTVVFFGKLGERAQLPITGDGTGLTPSGTIAAKVVEEGGKGYDTHYHFEYVQQARFEEEGAKAFEKPSETPEEDLGTGGSTEYVGADLPALTAGETYRFRVVATNTSPGNPVVHGEEETLTVALVPSTRAEPGACPNELTRRGLSGRLPDCRAYEQLTPVDKGGAAEIFNYGGSAGQEGAFPGEDGDHLEYGASFVRWGSGPSAGQGPYFFARGETGWQTTASAAQPEAGVDRYTPQLFAPDLTAFAFEAGWQTAAGRSSPRVEFKAGPPGGPYAGLPPVPREEAAPGWVGASRDFSKLVLQVTDHTLLGHSTHTQEGDDLYEYSNGRLRPLNVSGPAPGVSIGRCGAVLAGGPKGSAASDNAVSKDGSQVFFEEVPGGVCSGAKHLYVRVNGGEENAQTIDIGTYRFLKADPEGRQALLEKSSGENAGLYLYKNGAAPQYLRSTGIAAGAEFSISEDLSTVYIRVGGRRSPDLYRYDISGGKLIFVTHLSVGSLGRTFYSISPDGRYFYFIAETVAGLPAGGEELEQLHAGYKAQTSQVFRYDNAEQLIQCMSCASPTNPEPRLSALFVEGDGPTESGDKSIASADGNYVFFDTPAALIPTDVDGETAPEASKSRGGEHESLNYSLSSDVYEWRREGVDGCIRVQGCLAVITSGSGGFLNILLGTTPSGHDVFFATSESLLPSDNDTASDIYDARVGGGFAEPPSIPACEGDACSAPFVPPTEITPASAVFHGVGNKGAAVARGKDRPKAKRRCKTRPKRRCKARKVRRAKHAERRAKSARGAGR